MAKTVFSPFLKQCFVTTAVGINIIGLGCAIGFPAILLPQLKKPGSGIQLTKTEESWLASIFALSMLLGNLITAPLMDRLGRKGAHYALTIPCIAGWFMTILATSVPILIFGRVVLGTSAGILTTLRSVLVGEYSSPNYRGAFLTTVSLTQAFGIFFIHLIGSLLTWQMSALISVFFPFISLLMIIYTPESPSWLAEKGKYEECKNVFRWLRGDSEEEELEEMIEARIALEKEKIKNTLKNDNRLTSLLDTIGKKEFYKPIVLMIHANVLLNFSGGTTMAAYSTVILGLVMGPATNVHFWMVFLDTQRIVSNTLAVYVTSRVKRRTMMFSTGGLCIVSHLAIALYVYGKVQGWITIEGIWLPALLINIQFFTVGMGTVPMPTIIAGEVLPLEYRSIGGTITNAAGVCAMFLALKTFPAFIDSMGLSGTYTLYAIFLSYNLAVLWVLLPETKGRTLQQIEDEFRGRPLRPDEIEARQSLQSNPIEMYKRKLSESKISITYQ